MPRTEGGGTRARSRAPAPNHHQPEGKGETGLSHAPQQPRPVAPGQTAAADKARAAYPAQRSRNRNGKHPGLSKRAHWPVRSGAQKHRELPIQAHYRRAFPQLRQVPLLECDRGQGDL